MRQLRERRAPERSARPREYGERCIEFELRRATNDEVEELRRADALKAMGVDLTQHMVAVESAKPDRHVRVESSVAPGHFTST